MTVRLHWGCGSSAVPGWINSDRAEAPDVDIVADIRDGLPLESESVDYAVSIHALQEVPYEHVDQALQELWRVLRRGGVLRLGLPDLERGIAAYQAGDRDHFAVPDIDARSLGGKLVLHVLWYGHSRLLFTADFAIELLARAGFDPVVVCAYRETASPYAEIVQFDNRERETLFVEGVKPLLDLPGLSPGDYEPALEEAP